MTTDIQILFFQSYIVGPERSTLNELDGFHLSWLLSDTRYLLYNNFTPSIVCGKDVHNCTFGNLERNLARNNHNKYIDLA